jgi:hypothetical protein
MRPGMWTNRAIVGIVCGECSCSWKQREADLSQSEIALDRTLYSPPHPSKLRG